jgi:hypothetical protein
VFLKNGMLRSRYVLEQPSLNNHLGGVGPNQRSNGAFHPSAHALDIKVGVCHSPPTVTAKLPRDGIAALSVAILIALQHAVGIFDLDFRLVE